MGRAPETIVLLDKAEIIVEAVDMRLYVGYSDGTQLCFKRERNTTLSHIDGSGIGMGITKSLWRAHGWHNRSGKYKQGEGSTFTVTIPCEKVRKQFLGKKTKFFQKNCLKDF